MKRIFLFILIIISIISCEKGEKTVKVPQFLVNKAIAKKFSIEKNLVLARAVISDPKVSFSGDRLVMNLSYKMSLMGEKLEGKTKVSSKVSFNQDTREVYLDDLLIDEIKNNDGTLVEKGKVYDILNELLANYIAKKPVYEMEEKYKDYEIKNIKIENGSLYVTVEN